MATGSDQGENEQKDMLEEMRRHQESLGRPPKDCDEKDPRKVLAETITYFENNVSRMDYPRYRTAGLPLTSAYMESFVKEMNYRVKGTEKFWSDGPSAEAILQLRAAKLSDDDRLRRHMRSRPGNPFRPNVRRATHMTTANAALLVGEENIREVIAFPKTQKASDLMTEAPGSVDDDQLAELHLRTVKAKA